MGQFKYRVRRLIIWSCKVPKARYQFLEFLEFFNLPGLGRHTAECESDVEVLLNIEATRIFGYSAWNFSLAWNTYSKL